MDLPSLCGSARVCYLAGQRFWVRPLSLDALGTVLAWLDDVLPGREGRTMPPKVSTPEAQAALDAGPGLALLAWLGLRDQDIGYEQAAELMLSASEGERLRFVGVLFGRRRTYQPGPGGADIAETWWGPHAVNLIDRYPAMTLESLRGLTLDQLDALATGGCGDEDPERVSQELLERFDAMARANRAAKEAAETNGQTEAN